jgi:hypothetical protein
MVDTATGQFETASFGVARQLIHSTIRLECRTSAGATSSGTGFHYRFKINNTLVPAIITNKHVVKDAVACAFHLTLADQGGFSLGKHERITIQPFDGCTIAHPDPNVDLALIPFQPLLLQLASANLRPFYIDITDEIIPPQNQFAELTPLEDITMIGYPSGIWDNINNLPILRRGITATPCWSDYRGRTEFLIDAAIFPGSSGSPVFIFNTGSYPTENGIVLGGRLLFIGILYATHLHTVTGEIKEVTIPTATQPRAFSAIPNNLGICIRSSRLADFVPSLKQLIDGQNRPI